MHEKQFEILDRSIDRERLNFFKQKPEYIHIRFRWYTSMVVTSSDK